MAEKKLWEAAGVPDYTCPSVVARGDAVGCSNKMMFTGG